MQIQTSAVKERYTVVVASSHCGTDAKRTRRRLERQWRSHQQESDRVAYRRACRSARKLIQASRRDYFQQKLSSASDAKQRWSVAKHLLHSADTAVYFDDSESRRLCCDFSNFFVDKVMSLKQAVAKTVASLSPTPFADPAYAGPQFLASLPAHLLTIYRHLFLNLALFSQNSFPSSQISRSRKAIFLADLSLPPLPLF